jgi:hypothetical protein
VLVLLLFKLELEVGDGGNSRPTRMYFASCGFELCLNLGPGTVTTTCSSSALPVILVLLLVLVAHHLYASEHCTVALAVTVTVTPRARLGHWQVPILVVLVLLHASVVLYGGFTSLFRFKVA